MHPGLFLFSLFFNIFIISLSYCSTAHPSCLNYSPELVEQIRSDDSWQCIDCKACTICDGTSDPVSQLCYSLEVLKSHCFVCIFLVVILMHKLS